MLMTLAKSDDTAHPPRAPAAEPRSRFAADAACAGGRRGGRRKVKSQICHRLGNGCRSGSTNIGRLKTAATNGFCQVSFQEMLPCRS